MIDSLKKLVRPGSILLFHNDTENTPAALRRLIPELKGEGYEFVLIEDLVLKENYMQLRVSATNFSAGIDAT